jgi:hypothetical protein
MVAAVVSPERGSSSWMSAGLIPPWQRSRATHQEASGCIWSVPTNRGKNTTLLSSMSLEGMGPSLSVQGATTSRVFETYVEEVLAASLKEGQISW